MAKNIFFCVTWAYLSWIYIFQVNNCTIHLHFFLKEGNMKKSWYKIYTNILFDLIKLQDWWDAHLESGGYGFWLSYVPKVLLAVVITLMDEAYFKVAVWLNDLGMCPNDNRVPILYTIFLYLSSLSLSLSSSHSSDIIVSPCDSKYKQLPFAELFASICVFYGARLVQKHSIYFR